MHNQRLWVGMLISTIFSLANVQLASAKPPESPASSPTKIFFSPINSQLLGQPTANQLAKGQVSLNLDVRSFFFPNLVASGVDDNDSAVNFNTGFSWGISDQVQLSLQFQHVDSSSPVQQGEFVSERTEDNEAALELQHAIWQNSHGTQKLSGVLAASWGTRGFQFTDQNRVATEINNRDVFVALATPLTTQVSERWELTFTPTLAFFKEDTAAFFRRLPADQENSFGTVFGLGGGFNYKLLPRLALLGDVFLPLTGNNSINRNSGAPDQAIAYNVGLRYLTSSRLGLELYATNSFASYAPLSLTADRDFLGIGANLIVMPDIFAANNQDSTSSANVESNSSLSNLSSYSPAGLAFFDGGTIPTGQLTFNVQGGGQGLLTAIRYGVLPDFTAGVFLDYVAGNTDESEQGFSGKVRLAQQSESFPITLSVAGTVSLTNEPFINFLTNDTSEFERRNLSKSVPIFTPGGDELFSGKRLILTLAFPVHHQLSTDNAVWLTPIVGFAQRLGTEIGGFNLGGEIALSEEFGLIGEVGANFIGEGNSFIDGQLADRIPWNTAVRWRPSAWQNQNSYLELYLTNRVGSSTWHQLRVREDNQLAIGAGLSLPLF